MTAQRYLHFARFHTEPAYLQLEIDPSQEFDLTVRAPADAVAGTV
jgi:hypothetical protein